MGYTAVRYALKEIEERLKKDYGIEQINKVVDALRMRVKRMWSSPVIWADGRKQ